MAGILGISESTNYWIVIGEYLAKNLNFVFNFHTIDWFIVVLVFKKDHTRSIRVIDFIEVKTIRAQEDVSRNNSSLVANTFDYEQIETFRSDDTRLCNKVPEELFINRLIF